MIKIKNLTFKTALGLAILALFIISNINLAHAEAKNNILTNTQIDNKADFNSATHIVGLNANRTTYGDINILKLSSTNFATPPATPIEIGYFTLTSGSGQPSFSYVAVNGINTRATIGGNITIVNDKTLSNGYYTSIYNNPLSVGKNVTIKSIAGATSQHAKAASLFVLGTTGNNSFGGNIIIENAAIAETNPTSMLSETTDKNIITGYLSVKSTGNNANSIAYFNASAGTTQINSGVLTVVGFSGATNIDNTKAMFKTLDFSNSQGANVKVENATLKLTNLTLAGDKDNTFNFANINNELTFNSGILTVGNENTTGANGTLNIISTTAATTVLDFSNAAFYLKDLVGGDVALTVTGLAGGVATKMVDVSAVNPSNVMLALAGNKLQKGETLTLITGDIVGGTASLAQTITSANIINDSAGNPLNPGLYKISEYTVYWNNNNSLILSIAADAIPNPIGSIGSNTNKIWFEKLDNPISHIGGDGTSYLTADDIANLDNANSIVDAYNNLSPNAKELYKDLAFKTQEPGFDNYKWVDTPEATDSRLALDDYFGVVVPQLVADYNASHGPTDQVSKDDYIIAFMNDLDPFIHTVGGLHISRVAVDSMDIILDNANTTNSSLAYAQSVAAGENTDYWRIWAKTSATWDKLANQGFYAGYTGSHFAGYLGGDRNFGNARIGVAIGAGKSKLDWDNNAKTEADNIIAKLYGEYDYNNFTFGASIGGGNTSVEAERFVAGTKRKADYDVSMFAFDIYSKYNHKTENFEFTPEIGLSYLKTKQDSFTERGAAGMYFDTLNNDSALAYLKVTANVPVELENGIVLKPRASAGISHELADNNSTIRSSFIGQPGQFVNNKGSELKRTSVDVGVGLEANFTNDVSAYIQYDAQIQSDYKRQTASAGLEFRF